LHEGAAALMARDLPFLLQDLEGAPQRAAADSHLVGESALRRNAAAGGEPAVCNQLPKLGQGLVCVLQHRITLCSQVPAGPIGLTSFALPGTKPRVLHKPRLLVPIWCEVRADRATHA